MGALDDLIASRSPQGGGSSALDGLIAKYGGPQSSQLADIAKSGASGLVQGGAALLGLPGDIVKLGRWTSEQVGLGDPSNNARVMGSSEVLEDVKKLTGEFYKPQTTAGEYAETIGSFAPAVLGGVGGVGRRVVQAVVPAVTSETAGQVARNVAPDYEGAARLVGGIGGIAATARRGASKLPKGAAPETDELKQMANLAYARAEKAGLEVKGSAFRGMVHGLINEVKAAGIDRTLHPKAVGVMERLAKVGDEFAPRAPGPMAAITGVVPKQSARGIPLAELDTLRRVARGAAKSIEPDERRIAKVILNRIDDFMDNGINQNTAKAGNWREAVMSLKEARSLWNRMRKSEQIDDILDVAKDRAGQFSVSGNENAIRTGFRQLSMKIKKDKREAAKWTPEERRLIGQLANMGSTVNILRTIGKLAPRSAVSIGGGVAYGVGNQDPTTTAAAWGVGSLAQLAALGLTKRKAGQLQNRVRAGNMSLIPGRPSAPGAALLGGQAAALPLRDQLPD